MVLYPPYGKMTEFEMGIRAVICVPELVLPHKMTAMRQLGAEVVIHGQTQDDAERHVQELEQAEGLTFVSAFDDPHVIAGQGTIGLEILEECPQVSIVIAPLSGGGLLGGIAIAMKAAAPAIRVIGVSQAREPAMVRSLAAGYPVAVVERPATTAAPKSEARILLLMRSLLRSDWIVFMFGMLSCGWAGAVRIRSGLQVPASAFEQGPR